METKMTEHLESEIWPRCYAEATALKHAQDCMALLVIERKENSALRAENEALRATAMGVIDAVHTSDGETLEFDALDTLEQLLSKPSAALPNASAITIPAGVTLVQSQADFDALSRRWQKVDALTAKLLRKEPT